MNAEHKTRTGAFNSFWKCHTTIQCAVCNNTNMGNIYIAFAVEVGNGFSLPSVFYL